MGFNFILLLSSVFSLKNNNKKMFIFICSLLLFLACFREKHIGVDSITYYEYGNILKNMSFKEIFLNNIWIEKGYSLYSKVLMLTGEPYTILIVSSVITLTIIFKFIFEESENCMFSLFLFQGLMYYYDSLNIIRQYIALIICLKGYNLILKNKKSKIFLLSIISFFFHKTSILFWGLFFLVKIKINRKIIIIICSITIILYLQVDRILLIMTSLFPVYKNYLNAEYYKDFNLGNRIFFVRDFLIFCMLYKEKYYITKKERIDMWIVILSTVISFFSIKFGIFIRIQLYFSIYYIIIIPNVVNKMKNKKKTKMLIIFFIIIYYLIIFWNRKEWYLVYPYKSFLF